MYYFLEIDQVKGTAKPRTELGLHKDMLTATRFIRDHEISLQYEYDPDVSYYRDYEHPEMIGLVVEATPEVKATFRKKFLVVYVGLKDGEVHRNQVEVPGDYDAEKIASILGEIISIIEVDDNIDTISLY